MEWNTAYSCKKQGFVNEIIEFGAVRLNETLAETGSFQQFVRTRLSRKLNSKVVDLTHLTTDELKTGVRFGEALEELGRFMGKDTLLLTWSTTDLRVLLENCSVFTKQDTLPFLERYVDLQWYAQDVLGLGHRQQVGLGAAAEAAGLSCDGLDLHRALDDSRLSADIFRRCYRAETLEPVIANAQDPTFYERLHFKNYYIVDLKSPEIRPDDLRMRCEQCGYFARRTSKWKNHNKGFCADFQCRHCGYRFRGRIQVKKKFDDVEIRRSQRALEPIGGSSPSEGSVSSGGIEPASSISDQNDRSGLRNFPDALDSKR